MSRVLVARKDFRIFAATRRSKIFAIFEELARSAYRNVASSSTAPPANATFVESGTTWPFRIFHWVDMIVETSLLIESAMLNGHFAMYSENSAMAHGPAAQNSIAIDL